MAALASASTIANTQAPLDIKNSSLTKQAERLNAETSEAVAPRDDKKIADSIWEIQNALVKVQAQLEQNRPDIMDDVESHYGMHKIVGGTPSITSSEGGTNFDHGVLAVGPASHSSYNAAMTPPWDFTLQNGEIKVFSNKMTESKYQTAKLGEAGYGNTSQTLVSSLTDEQVSHIQTELNKNTNLLHGLNAFYEGLTGYSGTKKDLFITPNGADLGTAGAIPIRQLMKNAYLASYSEKAGATNINETDEAKITRLHVDAAKELAPGLSAGINTYA